MNLFLEASGRIERTQTQRLVNALRAALLGGNVKDETDQTDEALAAFGLRRE